MGTQESDRGTGEGEGGRRRSKGRAGTYTSSTMILAIIMNILSRLEYMNKSPRISAWISTSRYCLSLIMSSDASF